MSLVEASENVIQLASDYFIYYAHLCEVNIRKKISKFSNIPHGGLKCE